MSAPFSLLRTLAADAKQAKSKGAAAPPPPPPAAAAAAAGKKESEVAKAPKAPKERKERKPPSKLRPWGEQETIRLLRLAERFGEDRFLGCQDVES